MGILVPHSIWRSSGRMIWRSVMVVAIEPDRVMQASRALECLAFLTAYTLVAMLALTYPVDGELQICRAVWTISEYAIAVYQCILGKHCLAQAASFSSSSPPSCSTHAYLRLVSLGSLS